MSDLYTNSKLNASGIGTVMPGRMLDPWEVGQQAKVAKETFEVAVADAAADVRRFFKARDPNEIPLALMVMSDGMAGLTDCDIGLFKTNLGAAKSVNCLADGMDLTQPRGMTFGPRRWSETFVTTNTGAAADGTTYEALIAPGCAAKVVGASVIAKTPPTVGTDVIKILNGSSAGNTMLSAATFDANGLTANQASTMVLTSTAADLVLAKAGAASAVYVAYVAGTQTVDAIDVSITVWFEELNGHGLSALAIEDIGKKRLFEIAGDAVDGDPAAGLAIPAGGYDFGLTFNSEPTAAGTLAFEYWYIQG